MKIIEHYLAPIVRVQEDEQGRINWKGLCGTAFFINSRGAFVTARHVIEDGIATARKRGGNIALSVRKAGDDEHTYIGEIQDFVFADEPYDIAVGYIDKPTRSCFYLADDRRPWLWDDLHTVGYPESAVSRSDNTVRTDVRGLRGNLVRKVPPGQYLAQVGSHPAAFELSFAIPSSMSGSPLVMRYGPDEPRPPGDPLLLFGVCVGNSQTTIGKGVETYGVAQDLRPLRSWKPACLGGETLGEAIWPEI